ncbi:Plant lipid transfer protein/Par allergen [Sesbania bispinosa]|nr:Plant lipid transfer protein/Par allergen [Sesbania bispinosa]
MTPSTSTILVALLLLFVASSSLISETKVECDDLVSDLQPCIPYLKGGGDKPSPTCCEGAKALGCVGRNVQEKRDACKCIKAAAEIINPKPENANDLPKKCGIQLPFKISQFMDCSRIG